MRDARKSLQQLEAEWSTCIRCSLADRRINEGHSIVFGEGTTRGIMFIGEGPGKEEEAKCVPFVGPSGRILRKTIDRLGLTDVYITNAVACRSCGQAYSSEGQPLYNKNRRTGDMFPVIKDQPPTQEYINACAPRLHEQIYLVDPILIVALGGEAVKALIGKPASITKVRGYTQEIEIDGAWSVPSITESRGVWGRKVKGVMTYPSKVNKVRYLMLPTLHPAYVLRNSADRRDGNAAQQFAEDMLRAASIYDRYMLEVYGVLPGERHLSEDDVRGVEE